MKAVNLIPAEQRERTSGYANRSQGVAYVVLGVLAGLALMALLYGVARHNVGNKQAEAAKLQGEAQQVQSQATSLSPYKTFISIRESREKTVRELVDSRFDWAHMLSEVGRVLPVGVSIGSMEGCVNQPSTTGGPETSCSSGASSGKAASSGSIGSATPAGSVPHFTITGCALSQSLVARTLTDLKLMNGAKEVELASAAKTGTSTGASGGGGAGASCPKGNVSFSLRLSFQPLPSPPPAPATPPASTKSVPASTPTSTSAHSTNAAAHANGKRRSVAARTSGRRAG